MNGYCTPIEISFISTCKNPQQPVRRGGKLAL